MVGFLLGIIYLSFISLGLPDSLLGAAWPSIYPSLHLPVAYAGIISAVISLGTIISSLNCERLTKKLGTGLVTAISVFMTATALFGFSVSGSFLSLCLWAIPYGLGAGSVDAALNNYVAINFKSRHMSWLHCMWGVGTIVSPYIMSYALTNNLGWHTGYRYVAVIQIVLSVFLFLSLPVWKTKASASTVSEQTGKALSLREIFAIRGAKEIMTTFFCYCALESVATLWSGSYLVLNHNLSEEIAAGFSSLFFIGITVGRALSGFLTIKFNDTKMIRMGIFLIFCGIGSIILIPDTASTLVGLIVIGLGCAPVYPCIIHSTPQNFGEEKSRALIGVQMASAYTGTCLMPPLFGFLSGHTGAFIFPYFLLAIGLLMLVCHEKMLKNLKTS